jgi:hypothetical protein
MRRRGLASKARRHVKGSCLWAPPYADINLPLTMARGALHYSLSPRYAHSMAELCWFLVFPCASLTWFSSGQSSGEFSAICELVGVCFWSQAPCRRPCYPAPPSQHETCPMPRPRGRPRRGSPWRPRRPPISPPTSPSSCSSPLTCRTPFLHLPTWLQREWTVWLLSPGCRLPP